MRTRIASLALALMMLLCIPAAAEEGKPDPLGKLAEPVTLTAILNVGNPDPGMDEGLTPENNYYMQFLEEQLNIKIEYLWAVPSSQYQEKFGVSLASGDLPDIIKGLNPVQFEMLRSNDMLADISTGFDYLVPSLEEYWMRSPETFAIYNFDGQQLGVPQYWDQKRDAMIMYVRQDWLDKLGLAVPTTVEELRNVAVAFAEMDPDGNGVKDTYGLALNNMGANKAKTPKSVAAALQMFGGYADAWLDDGQGGLMNGTIQPAIKDGLTYLHELYTLGAIDPEFVVKDDDKVSEDIISGKAGIFFSVFWEMSTTAYNTVANNHDARWAVARLPGVGGTANVSLDEVAITGIIAVNKTCPSMEAFIKLMNYAHIWEDFTWENTDGTITTRFKEAPDFQKFKTGWAWQWMPVNCILDPNDVESQFTLTNAAYDAKDPSLLTTSKTWRNYNKLDGYNEWKKNGGEWTTEYSEIVARIDKQGSWSVAKDIYDQHAYVFNRKYGLATETQQTKGSTLQTMAEETFLKIINGQAEPDAFDTFVSNWHKLGGDEITAEVNEWFQAK